MLISLAFGLVLAAAAYAAWRWTPLSEWVDVPGIYGWLRSLRTQPLAPYLVIGVYVVASQIMFPITVLIVATAYAFGPWLGFAYAMIGSLLIGVTQELATHSVIGIPTDLKTGVAFVVLIVVLLVRPQGIMGSKRAL